VNDRGNKSDFMGLARAQEKCGPVLVRATQHESFSHAQRLQVVCVAEDSRSTSLVDLEFSCWGYSCLCASLPPAAGGCAVAQNDARRKSGCLGVEHRLLPFEALKKVTRP
jgi:hypothetical protein